MPPKPKPLPVNWERIKRYREETGVNLFPRPRFPEAFYSPDTPPHSPSPSPPRSPPPPPQKKKREDTYKLGGTVKKTGKALLHAGEVVVPVHRVATIKKIMKKL